MANVKCTIDHTGTYRALGLVIKPLVGAPRYRDTNRLVTESDWIEFDAWPDVITVKDQMQTNSCNPHALSLSMEQARWVTGQDHVRLDPWSLYAALCQGDDSTGTAIIDGINLLKRFGCPPFGAIVPGTYDPKELTPDVVRQAYRFRAEGAEEIADLAEFMSAVQRREPITFSVCVGSDFDDMDADGVPKLGRGLDNHAVNAWGGCRYSSLHKEMLIKCTNSWPAQAGKQGISTSLTRSARRAGVLRDPADLREIRPGRRVQCPRWAIVRCRSVNPL